MTTASSPVSALRSQAERMAKVLKAAERGLPLDVFFVVKILEVRKWLIVKFVIAMDDKIMSIEMSWALIAQATEAQLVDSIIETMQTPACAPAGRLH